MKSRQRRWQRRLNKVGVLVAAALFGPWTLGFAAEVGMAEQPSVVISILQMLGALALVLGLLLLSLHGLKRWRARMGGGPAGSQIQVLDVRTLAPKSTVALVEVAGQWLLLGIGANSVDLLTRVEPQQTRSAGNFGERKRAFSRNLIEILGRRSGKFDHRGAEGRRVEE
jgi:flagellar biosynthetic protein FliO